MGEVDGYPIGDPLEFTVMDKDVVGKGEPLGHVTLPAAHFLQDGFFEGVLPLEDTGEGSADATLHVRVEVMAPEVSPVIEETEQQRDTADASTWQPPEPTLESVCSDIDKFEATMQPVPRLGNFFMTPRGDRLSAHPQ